LINVMIVLVAMNIKYNTVHKCSLASLHSLTSCAHLHAFFKNIYASNNTDSNIEFVVSLTYNISMVFTTGSSNEKEYKFKPTMPGQRLHRPPEICAAQRNSVLQLAELRWTRFSMRARGNQ